MILHLIDLGFHRLDQFICFERIVFRYPLDPDLGKPDNIFFGNFSLQLFLERFKPFVYRFDDTFPGFTLFDIKVYPVLDKYLFQGSVMPLVAEFAQPDFQFCPEQMHRMVGIVPQDVLNRQKRRLAIMDHAAVR